MRVEYWKTIDVQPYHNNPRINDDAVAAVMASIREFGFRQPLVYSCSRLLFLHIAECNRHGGNGADHLPARSLLTQQLLQTQTSLPHVPAMSWYSSGVMDASTKAAIFR